MAIEGGKKPGVGSRVSIRSPPSPAPLLPKRNAGEIRRHVARLRMRVLVQVSRFGSCNSSPSSSQLRIIGTQIARQLSAIGAIVIPHYSTRVLRRCVSLKALLAFSPSRLLCISPKPPVPDASSKEKENNSRAVDGKSV